jgi:hypothetical protein
LIANIIVSVHLYKLHHTSSALVISFRKSFLKGHANQISYVQEWVSPVYFILERSFPREEHDLHLLWNMSEFHTFPINIDALLIFLGK